MTLVHAFSITITTVYNCLLSDVGLFLKTLRKCK